uniref:Ig-like domain-containing protein n=1 Tax=Neolamprologus brichardi TaxID=32507 RepID=A0A3Q4H462_NEOBR
MKTFILITALLLCSFVSQNVEVQPGEEVTLQCCSNFSRYLSHIFWFKMASSPNASCISAMSSSDSNVSFCDGFKKSKFHMTSNTSMLFLEIKQVNSSDSALYFCGEKQSDGKTIISSGTYLKKIKKNIFILIVYFVDVADGLTYEQMMTVILGNLTVFLLLVIVSLAVKIRRFHTVFIGASKKGENLIGKLSFHPKAKIRRPEPPRELEPNVVYAATR